MDVKQLTPAPTEEFQVHSPDMQGGDNFKAFEANKKRNERAEGSTAGEDLEAFGLSMREMQGASQIFDWVEFDSGTMFSEDSPEFLSTWNQEAILAHMDRNEFGMQHFNRLSKANNQNTLSAITDGIYQEEVIDERIQTHITRTSQTVGTMTGAFLDLDIAFPAAKLSKVATVAEAMKMNAIVMGTQTAWEIAHSHVNEDYTASDAVMSVAMMGVITAGVTARQMKKYSEIEQYSKSNKIDEHTAKYNYDAADVSARESTVKGQSFNPNKNAYVKSGGRPATVSSVIDEMNTNFTVSKKVTKVDVEGKVSKMDIDADDLEIKVPKDKDVVVGIQQVTKGAAENIASMLEEVKNLLKNADKDDLKNADSVVRKEIKAITDIIRKESGNEADTIQDMLQYKIKKNADGSGQFVNKSGVPFGRKLTAVMIAGLGGGALYADDGSGNFGVKDAVGNLLLLGAAVFIGAKGMKAYQREGTIAKAVTKTYENARGVVSANDTLKKDTMWQWGEKQSMIIRTQLTETYAQFAKAGGTAKEMADKFLVNYADGIPQSAEIEKRRLARIAEAEIMKVETPQFKAWQEEMGYKATPIVNFIDHPKQLDEFRELIINTVDGLAVSESKAVNAVAKEFQKQMKKLYDEATESGVLGYGEGKIKYTKDYVPRYWKTGRIRGLLVGIDAAANRTALQGSIATMMEGTVRKRREKALAKFDEDMAEYTLVKESGGKGIKKPKAPVFEGSEMDEAMKQANDFIKHSEGENIARRGRANEATMSRLEAEMKKQGIDMTDDMKAIFDKQGDKIDRAKYKIDLDYSKFVPFVVKENGVDITIGLGDIIDRNSK
ncbi:MAG: hypothetical protein J7L08_01925, partial [Candidatus Aenigmarchaeota archaeon]|nr:hypothetical protein [Candidatus Aenigmarchaeota archaeon]